MAEYPTSFDKEALLACARGELFRAGERATAPAADADDGPDHRTSPPTVGAHGKGHVVAEFDINTDLWFFECHFPGNPIMPGCLGSTGSGSSPASNSAGAGLAGARLCAWRRRGEAHRHGPAGPEDADLPRRFHQGRPVAAG